MVLLKVTNAKYVGEYKIDLSFNDGVNTTVDLKKKIFSDHRNIFVALRDIDYFKKFIKNRWTIEWDNGLDLAPEYLYELATKQNDSAATNALAD